MIALDDQRLGLDVCKGGTKRVDKGTWSLASFVYFPFCKNSNFITFII